MYDPAPTRIPSHYVPSRGRHLRSSSDSPPTGQRITDDLLSNLTPPTVVDAFRNPSGSLKACMEAATPAEQAFALRVAVASNSIHEWLAELSAWPWPAGGGSGGFETPAVRRKLFASGADSLSPAIPDDPPARGYTGSLPTAEIARYEKRLDDIAQGLEELDIEEIKNQVLTNHIMPLSRPGTPVMGAGRSAMSPLGSVARLDDLTALVTATTVQALPNLSRLARLMGAWSFRLIVLRKIPVFMAAVAAAEAALQSGWNALGLGANARRALAGTASATPSPAEFDAMRSALGRKVAQAGRDLDAMLDVLEGQPDTLPEDWIDRVDALEHGYGEWTVACERKIKEADLARTAAVSAPLPSAPAAARPSETSPDSAAAQELDSDRDAPPEIKIHPTSENRDTPGSEDDLPDTDNEFDEDAHPSVLEPPAMLGSTPDDVIHEDREWSAPDPSRSPGSDSGLSESSGPESRGRRVSDASASSTIIHGAPSTFTDSFSSDVLDHGTPEGLGRADGCDDASSVSSFRPGARSLSVSFSDKPTIKELPSFPSPPGTPASRSFVDDDLPTEPNSPAEMSTPGAGEDQLQQQISEILESVPAKIRLRAEPPAVNLNPPDFKMPTRKSSRPELVHRSQSNMSMRSAYSRSGTPSFTLAPAHGRSSRSRAHRGNQEIKLYHLSRSNGEAPIKLFIRCVGEHGERVMVRVGGGWADLGEYLKEYASHHLRRAAAAGGAADDKVEVKDIPRTGAVRPVDSTPPSRPASAMDAHSPISPLKLRKTRRLTNATADVSPGQGLGPGPAARPKTPLAAAGRLDTTPPSDPGSLASAASSSRSRSRSSSRISYWDDDAVADGPAPPLGMAGPRAKQVRMSEESRAWVESVTEKVRIASGEHRGLVSAGFGNATGTGTGTGTGVPAAPGTGNGTAGAPAAAAVTGGLEASLMDRGVGGRGLFGEMGKVGSTKRLFRRGF